MPTSKNWLIITRRATATPYYMMRYSRFNRIATHAGTIASKDVLRVEIP